MPDGIVMMYWDCPNCGTKKITGDHRACPSCGKDRTVQCYIVEGEGEITDAKGIADALSGPDWQCGHCGHFNKATMTECENCGTSNADGTQNKIVHYAPGVVPSATDEAQQQEASPSRMAWRADSHPDYASDSYTPTVTDTTDDEPRQIDLSRFIKPAGYMLLIAAVLFGIWFMFIRRVETTVTVSGFSWQRTVSIEKYAWVGESSLSGFPAGSRNQRKNWEVIGHHQEVSGSHTEYTTSCTSVSDGESCSYTDLGNGRSSRSCSPRSRQDCKQVPHQVTDYRTVDDWGYRYYYEIQRWVFSRAPQTAGNDRKVLWPEFTLATQDDPERETGRNEVYVIHYVDKDNKEYTRQVSYNEWIDYNQNATYVLTLNGIGTILDIKQTDGGSKQ